MSARIYSFSVDRGGTFTDVVCTIASPNGGEPRLRVVKLLSVDPAYMDAPTEGIRRCLELETGVPHPRGAPVDTSRVREVRMGTTVATNALLERTGQPFALLVTRGFRDVLHIGTQSRPRIFDLRVRCPDVLYSRVVEVDECVAIPLGDGGGPRDGPAGGDRLALAGERVVATTGEPLVVRVPLDLDAVRVSLLELRAAGCSSLAVLFKHAALYPAHEAAVGALARSLGFGHVSLSHEVLNAVKMVPRGVTACADAYLTPHIRRYLAGFTSGFDAGLSDGSVKLSFMQSDGGLAAASAFSGHRAILSGPAGGVVGYSNTTRWTAPSGEEVVPEQVIGFDMGGTSTDVSRCAGGVLEHVFEGTTAGVTIAAPQLDVNTVAAGGGSALTLRAGGLFAVGPESVGANPGPVCYRRLGATQLAVTDANVLLGRIQPAFFPSIFGPDEKQPLDADATAAAFATLAERVRAEAGDRAAAACAMSPDEVAYGFVRVANEAMCRPIRALTHARGHDAAAHTLAVFGGAGGQHACAIARALGVATVFVHRLSSVLSALGIGLAATVAEARAPCSQPLAPGAAGAGSAAAALAPRFAALELDARAQLAAQGVDVAAAEAGGRLAVARFLAVRFEGTDTALMVAEPPGGCGDPDYGSAFVAQYGREFGFLLDRPLVADDARVRATASPVAPGRRGGGCGGGRGGGGAPAAVVGAAAAPPPGAPPAAPAPAATASVYFEGGRVATPVHRWAGLPAGCAVPGPALLVDDISTVVVEPGCTAHVTAEGNLRIDVAVAAPGARGQPQAPPAAADASAADAADPVELALFSHRFMGIAEQMGRTLQRTAVSTNIKERLDFSCALFGPDGGLVANAPHLPVHLGAMQAAVAFQLAHWTAPGAEGLSDGDGARADAEGGCARSVLAHTLRPVLMSNHPQLAGGSHLPDITVITPVFVGAELVFFVASRGHHADVGGVTPGSMPPNSTRLDQEGAAVVAFKLVRRGAFDEAGAAALLAPSRALADCLSDLRAQAAANTRGIGLVQQLVAEHGLRTVQFYMAAIRRASEAAVRAMLRRFAASRGDGGGVVVASAVDRLDDGSPIAVRVTVDAVTGSATFDFSGTGPQVFGNTNAPPAVTYSAVIYALRCLVDEDIPLNQGCLAPVSFVLPPGSLLCPDADAAVVGGNVLTSQRVTDVVLAAFGAAAASCGCMGNLTFGDGGIAYYETIAGGSGAGPGWRGRSGVHTHMTNTRITDPEILERRFPVTLTSFTLRRGSGGSGRWPGGDGCVRELEALRRLTFSVLSERRALAPPGLAGGGDAQRGLNLWLRANGTAVNLGGKATVLLGAGDRLRVLTPGGGGFGAPGEGEEAAEEEAAAAEVAPRLPEPARGSVADYTTAQEGA